jgi:hypothetical protein
MRHQQIMQVAAAGVLVAGVGVLGVGVWYRARHGATETHHCDDHHTPPSVDVDASRTVKHAQAHKDEAVPPSSSVATKDAKKVKPTGVTQTLDQL